MREASDRIYSTLPELAVTSSILVGFEIGWVGFDCQFDHLLHLP